MLLTAYLDDSGTHDGSEWVTVGGLFASEEQWLRFDDKWTRAVKDDWGLPYFRMADFEGGFGPYADWTDEEHKSRLGHLLSIIEEHTMANVAVSIPVKAFQEAYDRELATFIGGPYGLAALECSILIPEVLRNAQRQWPAFIDARLMQDTLVAYIFESGTRGIGQVIEFFGAVRQATRLRERARVGAVGTANKRDYAGLQAADMVAYEVWKETPGHAGDRIRPQRFPLKQLSQRTNCLWKRADAMTVARFHSNIEQACKEGGWS